MQWNVKILLSVNSKSGLFVRGLKLILSFIECLDTVMSVAILRWMSGFFWPSSSMSLLVPASPSCGHSAKKMG